MLNRGELQLLAWFRFRAGRRRQCWWKQRDIAADTRLGLRTVQKYLARLVAEGFIESVRRGSIANLYNLKEKTADQQGFSFPQFSGKAVDACGSDTHAVRIEGPPILISEIQTKKEQAGELTPEEISHPRAQAVLRDRSFQERARRATHPKRYVAAVIRRELGDTNAARCSAGNAARVDRPDPIGQRVALVPSPEHRNGGVELCRANAGSAGSNAPESSDTRIRPAPSPIAFRCGEDSDPGCVRTAADSVAGGTLGTLGRLTYRPSFGARDRGGGFESVAALLKKMPMHEMGLAFERSG